MGTWRDPEATWSSSDEPSASAPPASAPGQDRYAEVGVLGRGGLGRVDALRDGLLDRVVARKVLLDDRPGARARFLREARVTARLEHPAIVPVYEVGTLADGTPWYTMKRVEGESLAEALRRLHDAPDQRLQLVDAVLRACQAVASAHGQGIVHRDLKPANVMLGAFGETWVVDWGLARAPDDPPVAPGVVVGTPGYMSPEQARGEPATPASDVWSLGAVLFAVLAGRAPLKGDDPAATLRRVREERPPPVATVAPTAPGELCAIVDRALAPDPAERYPDARALAEDLQAWTAGRRVTAYSYSPWQVLRRELWRRRYALLAVAAVAVALLAGVVDADLRDRAARRREEEVTSRALAESLASGGVVALREGDVLLAGARGAIALRYADLPEARGLVARALAAGSPRPTLRLDAGGPCAWLAATEDGRGVFCGGERLTAFRDGVPAWSLPGPSLDGALAEDGRLLVAEARSAVVVSTEDGTVLERHEDQDTVRAVAWARARPVWSVGGRVRSTAADALACSSTVTDLSARGDELHVVCVSGAHLVLDADTLAVRRQPGALEGVAFAVLPEERGAWMPRGRSLGFEAEGGGGVVEHPLGGYPNALARSPDGRWIAATTDRSVAHLLEVEGEGDHVLPTGARRTGVAFDRDGLWTSGARGPVRWSPPTPPPFESARRVARLLCFDGRHVIVPDTDGGVWIYDRAGEPPRLVLSAGRLVDVFPAGDRALAVEGGVPLARASWIEADGRVLPIGLVDASRTFEGRTSGDRLLWRRRDDQGFVVTDLALVEQRELDPAPLALVDGTPVRVDGRRLTVLDPVGFDPLRELALVEADPSDAAPWTPGAPIGVGPDGTWWFASATTPGVLAVDPRTGVTRRLARDLPPIAATLLRDGRLLVGDWDGTVRVLEGDRLVAVLPGRGARASQALQLDGATLLTTDWDGRITSWDLTAIDADRADLWARVLPETGFDWVDGRLVPR